MNSFILISKTPQQQQEYLDEFIQTHHISPFDQTIINEEARLPTTARSNGGQGSIGIEIVRKLQETLYLKPYKGDAKMIVIHHAERLTIEAQNAFLKVLEEPPTFVYLFLLAATEEAFLPTILSRCTLVRLTKQEEQKLDEKQLTKDLAILISGSIGEKLALAEQRALDKENSPQWLRDITVFIREQMQQTLDDKEKTYTYAHILAQLQEANKIIATTNVSPRTVLEHMLLQLT